MATTKDLNGAGGAVGDRARKKRDRRAAWGQPAFIDKAEMAHHCCASIGTIDDWVREGTFPPPRLQPGERKALWSRPHWESYRARGQWPAESFASGGGGVGAAGD